MLNEVKEGQMTLRTSVVTDFKATKLASIDAVPIGNVTAYKTLLGEAPVYEFVNTVKLGDKFPARPDSWTEIILTEEWANSFVNAVKAIPKPLFIGGHKDSAVHYKERAIPDGYITGGLVQNEVLYLRNSLPGGSTEERKALMRVKREEGL